MDIGLISAQYMNPAQNPFSSTSVATQQVENSGFDDLLRRLQNNNQEAQGGRPGTTEIDKTSELYEVCLELETMLIKNMIKGMRSTVMKTNFIDTGFAGEIYEDMLYDEYAKTYARNAGLGFAEMAYRELAGLR